MKSTIEIVDRGRGPQLSTSRLTVLDVFYYLHRGRDWNTVQQALPSLCREEFDLVVEYIGQHRAELVEQDRRAEERIQQGLAAQQAQGLHHAIDESVPVEERAEKLKAKWLRRPRQQAEKNGGHAAR